MIQRKKMVEGFLACLDVFEQREIDGVCVEMKKINKNKWIERLLEMGSVLFLVLLFVAYGADSFKCI